MNKFQQLGLSPATVEVLEELGFEKPTQVQEKAIPLLLQDTTHDFIGLAQTGTGKTAAFGLPLMELLDAESPSPQALIMAPTRELGQQIAKQLKAFSANNELKIEVVYGGASIDNQIKALRRPTQIVVATPGRLLDLIRRKAVKLEEVEYVVLDEADEMLNMGFKEDIDQILSFTSEGRNNWLFSATMPKEIRGIVKKYMDEPKEVRVNAGDKTNKDITHQYVVTTTANKVPALRRFLDLQPDMRGIMFCRTKRDTDEIAAELGDLGYGVEALHGDLSQGQRDKVMKRFKERSMQLLIATDVAARGIDVDDLTHVIHHKLPDNPESYTHRSGRTARAGKKGISLALINPREQGRIRQLESNLKVEFQLIEVPGVELIQSHRIQHWAELIVKTDIDPNAEQILDHLKDQFAHLDKDALLKRLITTQLDHLLLRGEEAADLNENVGSKSKTSNNGGANRYFINVGTMDGLTKGDLVHFLSDMSHINRNKFSDISLQKNCAFFNVEAGFDQGFSEKFQGIEVDGRAIRVNRDDDGPKKKKKDYSSRRPRGKYKNFKKDPKKSRRGKGRSR